MYIHYTLLYTPVHPYIGLPPEAVRDAVQPPSRGAVFCSVTRLDTDVTRDTGLLRLQGGRQADIQVRKVTPVTCENPVTVRPSRQPAVFHPSVAVP